MQMIGILLIIGSCSWLGIVKSADEKKRLVWLKEWHRLTLLLLQEIRFHTTLADAFQKIALRAREPYTQFLQQLSMELMSKEHSSLAELFAKELDLHLGRTYLRKEDLECMKMLGNMMQDADRAMQTQILERHRAEITMLIEELQQRLPEKQKLYRSLGVLGGVFLGILLL